MSWLNFPMIARSVPLFLALTLQVACGNRTDEGQRVPTEPIVVTKAAVQPTPSPRPVGNCATIGLMNVVGQPYSRSVALQAQDASRASKLQVIEPSQSSTSAPDGDRLTLSVNANGTIVDAACG